MKNDVQNYSKKMHLFNNLKSSLSAVASLESVGVLGKNSSGPLKPVFITVMYDVKNLFFI